MGTVRRYIDGRLVEVNGLPVAKPPTDVDEADILRRRVADLELKLAEARRQIAKLKAGAPVIVRGQSPVRLLELGRSTLLAWPEGDRTKGRVLAKRAYHAAKRAGITIVTRTIEDGLRVTRIG